MATLFVGVKEFRQNIARMARSSRKNKDRLIILNRNKPILEVRPLSGEMADLDRLALDIQLGLQDAAAGRVYSHQEIKTRFGIE